MRKIFTLALLACVSAVVALGCAGNYPIDRVSEKTHFATDKYDLDATSIDILNYKVAYLKHFPGEKIFIVGHADKRNTDKYNLDLGRHRAEEAKRYLVNNGIDPKRIFILTEGKRQDISPDLAENRRDEFFIVSPHQPY